MNRPTDLPPFRQFESNFSVTNVRLWLTKLLNAKRDNSKHTVIYSNRSGKQMPDGIRHGFVGTPRSLL